MKKVAIQMFSIFMLFMGLIFKIEAQTTINLEGNVADASALLDVQSNNQGFLMPRITENGRLSIGSPATGLLLFQTDNTPGFRYNNGTPNLQEWLTINTEETDSTYFDLRIPMDSVGNGKAPFVISEPGSYYFTEDVIMSTGSNSTNGITISSSHVSIDMNGFALRPNTGQASNDGIQITGNRQNIVIKNGAISGWRSYGIRGLDARESIFKKLQLLDNGLSGLNCDYGCLIENCAAYNNGFDGLDAGNCSIVVECNAYQNEGHGIQIDDGSIVIRSNAHLNIKNGFDLANGCKAESCIGSENEEDGFEIGVGSEVMDCNAYRNGRSGFDLFSSSLLFRSKASQNGDCITANCENGPTNFTASGLMSYGNGAKCGSNSQVINCTFIDNDLTGIRVVGTDAYIAGNVCIGNNNLGIYGESTGCLILGNICNSNGSSPNSNFTVDGNVISGGYEINSNSAFGPIIDVENVGDIGSTTNSNHPYANFEY